MSDDLCSKCRGSLQSGWVACPHCGVSLGAGTAGEVTGHADLMKRVEALELSSPSDRQPAEVDEETQAELDSILADAQDVEDAGHEFDPWDEAASLDNLGIIAGMRGDLDEAERLFKESLAIEREIGNREGEASSLNNLGNIAYTRGDLDEAERLHNENLTLFREIGNRQGEAASLGNLGIIAETRGDLDEAERLQRESLAIERELGNREGESASLDNLGIIASTRGDLDEAERLFKESRAIEREMGLLDDEEMMGGVTGTTESD